MWQQSCSPSPTPYAGAYADSSAAPLLKPALTGMSGMWNNTSWIPALSAFLAVAALPLVTISTGETANRSDEDDRNS